MGFEYSKESLLFDQCLFDFVRFILRHMWLSKVKAQLHLSVNKHFLLKASCLSFWIVFKITGKILLVPSRLQLLSSLSWGLNRIRPRTFEHFVKMCLNGLIWQWRSSTYRCVEKWNHTCEAIQNKKVACTWHETRKQLVSYKRH